MAVALLTLGLGCGSGGAALGDEAPAPGPRLGADTQELEASFTADLGPIRAAPADLPGSAPHLDLVAASVGDLGLEARAVDGELVGRFDLHVTEGPRTLPPPTGHFWLTPGDTVRIPLGTIASWRLVEAIPLPPPDRPGAEATQEDLVPEGQHAFRWAPSLRGPRHLGDGQVRMTAAQPGEVWLAMSMLVRVVEPGTPTLHLVEGPGTAAQSRVLRPGEHVVLDAVWLSHGPDDPIPALDGL